MLAAIRPVRPAQAHLPHNAVLAIRISIYLIKVVCQPAEMAIIPKPTRISALVAYPTVNNALLIIYVPNAIPTIT